MSSRAIQDNEVEALLKSLSFKSLDDRPQPGQYSGARILGSSQPLSMEQILSAMPRHKLSRTDFMNDELTKLKEKADHEASLPAERVALIRRAQLITTLDATYEMVNKSYRGQTPPTLQVLIDRPERYSSAKMKNLARINVSEMMARKTHKGNYLLCRTICPPVFDGGIGILLGVEDPQGDAAYMKLLNYATLLEASETEYYSIMPMGTILAIREPSYTPNPTVPELPFVKIDSPSDVIFIDPGNPVLRDVSWKTKLIVPPRPYTGEAWKAQGLKHFKESQWLSSAICFTNCIKFGFDVQVSRLNRSEVYLRLGWNNSALHDAQDALKSSTLSEDLVRKAVVRKLKALYAMGRYSAVLETARIFPNDKAIAEWVPRATRRMEEQSTGNYDWLKLFKDSEKGCHSPDVADFTGPIEVKKGQNGLRGTFVTRDVKAGELLMLHKPVACLPDTDKPKTPNIGVMMVSVPALKFSDNRGHYRLFCKVVLKLWDDRGMYESIRALFAGEIAKEPTTFKFPPSSVDSRPLEHPTRPIVDIDIGYVQGVVSCNSFGVGEGRALYAVPSLLNHSCLPTASREFLGDVFVLRAIQDMKLGEEVTIAYIDASFSYDEKRFRLMNSWRFNCSCNLCEADGGDDYQARETRRSLSKAMQDMGAKLNNTFDVGTVRRYSADAKKICDDLMKTYNSGHSDKAGGIKHELAQSLRLYADVLNRLGQVTFDLSYRKRIMELSMDSLTFNGLKVTDRTMSGALPAGGRGQKSALPVDNSRISDAHETCIVTVLEIAKLFKELGEKRRAQRWFDVAVWMENVCYGGGIAGFKLRRATTLNILGLSEYL